MHGGSRFSYYKTTKLLLSEHWDILLLLKKLRFLKASSDCLLVKYDCSGTPKSMSFVFFCLSMVHVGTDI